MFIFEIDPNSFLGKFMSFVGKALIFISVSIFVVSILFFMFLGYNIFVLKFLN